MLKELGLVSTQINVDRATSKGWWWYQLRRDIGSAERVKGRKRVIGSRLYEGKAGYRKRRQRVLYEGSAEF